MLDDLRRRVRPILNADSNNFNPLSASACLLDPALAKVLLVPEMATLSHVAKTFIINQCKVDARWPLARDLTSSWSPTSSVSSSLALSDAVGPPVIFTFLDSKMVWCRDVKGQQRAWNCYTTFAQISDDSQRLLGLITHWVLGSKMYIIQVTCTTCRRPQLGVCFPSICWDDIFHVWLTDCKKTQSYL